MYIRGEDGLGREQFTIRLAHGETPTAATERLGWQLMEPLSTEGTIEALVLRVRVHPIRPRKHPLRRPPRAVGLKIRPDEVARPRQRIAAYSLTTSTRGILATQFSQRTAAAGAWGLPGGGVDPGETPVEAAIREAVEETNQHIDVGPLLAVQTDHWIGRAPHGELEDFQAVRLFYRAQCPHPTTPRVLDIDGTTAQAQWVAPRLWSAWNWTPAYRAVLKASGLMERKSAS